MPRISWAASASLLLIALSASTAQAQWFEDSNPWVPYVSATAQGVFMDTEAGGINTVGGGLLPPFSAFDSDRDDTLGLGGAIGISQDHGSFRTRAEVEGMWYEDQEDLIHGSFPGPPGPATSFYTSNLDENWSVMGNVWVDLYVGEYLAWYLGGGAGIASSTLSTNDLVVAGRNSDQDFAWQIGTGMLINISDNAELDLGYRYVELGEVETNLIGTGGGIVPVGVPSGVFNLDRESHNFAVTLRYYLYE